MCKMSRGTTHQSLDDVGRQAELSRMQDNVDQLRAAERRRTTIRLTTG